MWEIFVELKWKYNCQNSIGSILEITAMVFWPPRGNCWSCIQCNMHSTPMDITLRGSMKQLIGKYIHFFAPKRNCAPTRPLAQRYYKVIVLLHGNNSRWYWSHFLMRSRRILCIVGSTDQRQFVRKKSLSVNHVLSLKNQHICKHQDKHSCPGII